MKREKTRGFRPRTKTAERLNYAEKLGINLSELINNVLDGHLRDYLETEIEQKHNQLRKAMEAPMP